MKSDRTKYEEAVARNLYYATQIKRKFKTLEYARHHIGIRADDKSFDGQLAQLIEVAE